MTVTNVSNLTADVSSGVPYVNDPDSETIVLTREDVEEFREIIRRTCGEELTMQEAWNRAAALVALGKMLAGPLPKPREGG